MYHIGIDVSRHPTKYSIRAISIIALFIILWMTILPLVTDDGRTDFPLEADFRYFPGQPLPGLTECDTYIALYEYSYYHVSYCYMYPETGIFSRISLQIESGYQITETRLKFRENQNVEIEDILELFPGEPIFHKPYTKWQNPYLTWSNIVVILSKTGKIVELYPIELVVKEDKNDGFSKTVAVYVSP